LVSSDASLSGHARGKLAVLDEVRRKWDRVHALVQQIYTRRTAVKVTRGALSQSSKEPLGAMMRQLTRQSAEITQLLADSGFAALAEDVQQLMAVARLGGAVQKATLFRMKELVALGYEGIELADRRVREEDRDNDLLRRAL
jgi:hypothetical protein